ncbi:MAG: NUDIX hydrolase [Beggiatoa sp. IS2]|nr:MAG: NUDIX hydrolase [Beggiatoa sp. IS2]
MKYCSSCGAAVVQKIPPGDNLLRYVCESCHTIYYQNPKIVAGCLIEWQDTILLCKRAIEPKYGLWTVPAGFMENLETTEQAAVRETWEEANAHVEKVNLYAVFSIPAISQVYVMFRATLSDLDFAPGIETLEVQLFTQDQIPWETLAFSVVRRTLTHYFQDRAIGEFPVHVGDIIHVPR